MTRSELHTDAMLRHLGAAYYESLHGRATQADVTRALETVEEQLDEQPRTTGRRDLRHPRGWSREVGDVMTTSVVTVDRITPYKEIVRLLAEHQVSGLPVLKMGREVVGVVTEADLLAAEASTARRLRASVTRSWWPRKQRHPALTAGELMTSPAITVRPHTTIPAAARLMTTHHVRRLPVVDDKGRLLGIVSRRDLLRVFLRPDEDIKADILQVLDETLAAESGETEVAVRNGIVTLTGALDPQGGPHGDLIPVAIRLMWAVDGVVDIIDHLVEPRAAAPAPAHVPSQREEET